VFVFLARVIAFVIAVSVIRAVVDYIKRLWQGTQQQSRPFPRSRPQTPVADSPAATLLQQDPVCGTYVATDTSLKKIIAGRVYFFCSAECRNKFTA
jgi:uncharacterized protein